MKQGSELVSKILVMFYMLINIVPNFQANSYVVWCNVISFMLIVIFNITVVLQKGITWKEVLAYVLIFFNCIFPLLTDNMTIFNRYVILSVFPISYLLSVSFEKINKSYILKQCSSMIVIITIFNLIISIYHVIQRPSVMRSINAGSEVSYENMRKGIGGYDLVYFWTLVLVSLFYIILFNNRKKKKQILFYVFATVVGTLAIFLSNFLTALLILGVATSILFFCWLIKTKKYIFAMVCVYMVIGMLLADRFLMDLLAPVILEIVPGGTTALRIETYRETGIIAALLKEFFADRMPLIKQSFQSALDTGFWGCMLALKSDLFATIGQHSFLFDTLALYGGAIFVLNIVLFMFPLVGRDKKPKKILNWVAFISLLIMLLLNNATASIALAYYIVIPHMSMEVEE